MTESHIMKFGVLAPTDLSVFLKRSETGTDLREVIDLLENMKY